MCLLVLLLSSGLINSYLLTENDILELTSLLDGAVLPSNLFADTIMLKDGVFHTTFRCHYKKVYTDGTAFTKDAVTKIVKGLSMYTTHNITHTHTHTHTHVYTHTHTHTHTHDFLRCRIFDKI